jgi:hypothetical protein
MMASGVHQTLNPAFEQASIKIGLLAAGIVVTLAPEHGIERTRGFTNLAPETEIAPIE